MYFNDFDPSEPREREWYDIHTEINKIYSMTQSIDLKEKLAGMNKVAREDYLAELGQLNFQIQMKRMSVPATSDRMRNLIEYCGVVSQSVISMMDTVRNFESPEERATRFEREKQETYHIVKIELDKLRYKDANNFEALETLVDGYRQLVKDFKKLGAYQDASQLLSECQTRLKALEADYLPQKKKYDEALAEEKLRQKYNEAKVEIGEISRRDLDDYSQLTRTVRQYKSLLKSLGGLGAYEDAQQLLHECQAHFNTLNSRYQIEKSRREAEQREKEAAASIEKKRRLLYIFTTVATAVIVGVIVFVVGGQSSDSSGSEGQSIAIYTPAPALPPTPLPMPAPVHPLPESTQTQPLEAETAYPESTYVEEDVYYAAEDIAEEPPQDEPAFTYMAEDIPQDPSQTSDRVPMPPWAVAKVGEPFSLDFVTDGFWWSFWGTSTFGFTDLALYADGTGWLVYNSAEWSMHTISWEESFFDDRRELYIVVYDGDILIDAIVLEFDMFESADGWVSMVARRKYMLGNEHGRWESFGTAG
ncbi:MAG: hypothetical protein FWE20_07975 [Defluviitaleaceae bacterium]|nr:hypothetical protein [Defluviitaleaceae bacterium]